jgi:hypothetical protein
MGEESSGIKSLARDVMRMTSGNTPQTDTTIPAALYDVMRRRQASKNDFLRGFLVRKVKRGLQKIQKVSGA